MVKYPQNNQGSPLGWRCPNVEAHLTTCLLSTCFLHRNLLLIDSFLVFVYYKYCSSFMYSIFLQLVGIQVASDSHFTTLVQMFECVIIVDQLLAAVQFDCSLQYQASKRKLIPPRLEAGDFIFIIKLIRTLSKAEGVTSEIVINGSYLCLNTSVWVRGRRPPTPAGHRRARSVSHRISLHLAGFWMTLKRAFRRR